MSVFGSKHRAPFGPCTSRVLSKSLILVGGLVLSTAGCVSTPTLEELHHSVGEAPERGEILSTVPFVRQTEGTCGEAALESVIHFLHPEREPPKAIEAQEGLGRFSFELAHQARSRDYGTREGHDLTLTAVLLWIDSGYPVITKRRVPALGANAYHFDVVIGYDDRMGYVVLHDGSEPSKVVSYESFTKDWTGYALVVLGNETLKDAKRAYEAENRGEIDEARRLYRAHLQQLPADLLVAYNLARLTPPAEAIAIYRAILELSPHDGPSLNNLASLLSRHRGWDAEAVSLLSRAIEVDPARRDHYEETLSEVLARSKESPRDQ